MLVGIITLGCDKNTVDNEYLAGLLEDRGCEVVPLAEFDPDRAWDAVVVTTCGFICDAKQQSIETIVDLADRKKISGNPARVFVAGCLAQRYSGDLWKGIPEIDGMAGVGQFDELASMILDQRPASGVKTCTVPPVPSVNIYRFMRRRRLDNHPHAFLKIADGCNHACAFCSIPLMKGRFQSVAPDILLHEARELLAQGVRELNLVAQDISMYGRDLRGGYGLPRLLRDLCALDGDYWVRCLYCYPGGVTRQLIEVMASEPKIVPYLDVPLQHLDPDMLKRMKRPFPGLDAGHLADRLRSDIPGITLRTTMLVGFPGETPQAHQRMLDGIERIQFDRLGVFQFSCEEGTLAASLPRQVGKPTRQKRYRNVMELQAEISTRRNHQRIGQQVRVLVEGFDPERNQWTGRSPAEAPEVDGTVYVASPQPLTPGQFVTVKIISAETYDVTGQTT